MQTVALVAGIIGAASGTTALLLRLLENYRRPRVRFLKRDTEDAGDWLSIEVVNPSLLPLIVRSAGVVFPDGSTLHTPLEDLGDRPFWQRVGKLGEDDGRKSSITVRARGACTGAVGLGFVRQHCKARELTGISELVGYCDTGTGKRYRTRHAARVDLNNGKVLR